MSQIIILGDPHIGKSINLGKLGIGAINSRVLDQLKLLDWTLEQAIDDLANDIIITGDVFEEPKPSPQLITFFMNWLNKCQANEINVHIILGNHDFLRWGNNYVSPLDIISEAEMKGISVYKDIKTILIGKTGITLAPFRDRKSFALSSNAEALTTLGEVFSYELASIPTTYHKVLVGHLALEGSIPVGDEIDDLGNELFVPLEMLNGYDTVLMGHVHAPQVLSDKPHIAHIGSMDISNFGETEHRKHIILYDTEKGTMSKRPLPCRPLRKISLSIPEGVKDSTEWVLTEIAPIPVFSAIVRVEIALSAEASSVSKSAVEKALISSGAFAVVGILESKKSLPIKRKEGLPNVSLHMDVSSAIDTYAKVHIMQEMQDKFVSTAKAIALLFRERAAK
jgi:exonuclease SbcD